MRKKPKHILLIMLFVFIALNTKATDWPISSNAEITLVTCGRGNEMHTAFGHSGLRVVDSIYGVDVVFNYGSSNYTPAQLYYHVLKGDPVLYIAIEPTSLFLQKYNNENRDVYENTLLLDSAQKHKIFNYLMWNADERNAAYGYNFFTNNCATKVRDVLLRYGVPISANGKNSTYRNMVDFNLAMQPWNSLALYIILGSAADQEISPFQSMYIPSRLQQSLKYVSMQQVTIVSRTFAADNLFQQYYAFISITILLLLMLAALSFNKNMAIHGGFIFILLLVTGSIGLLLTVQQFLSTNTFTQANYNLLWALPFNFVALALFWKRDLLLRYVRCLSVYLLIATIALFFVPQNIHYGFFIWLPLIAMYFYSASYKLSNQS